MPEWYVHDEGAGFGPFERNAVIDYLQFRDPDGVFVWREGLNAWMSPHDLRELAAALPPRPGPPWQVWIRNKALRSQPLRSQPFRRPHVP
jgi:hypothetical protein